MPPSFCTRSTRNTVSPCHSPIQALLLRQNYFRYSLPHHRHSALFAGIEKAALCVPVQRAAFIREVYLARLRWRKREPLFNAQTLGDILHHPAVCVGDGLHVRDLAAVKGLVARTVANKGCGFGIAVDSTLDLG